MQRSQKREKSQNSKGTLNWADDVEQQQQRNAPDAGGGSKEEWHSSMTVERGAARHRLNLSHGFVRQVIRNQHDRDAYEQQWQEAYQQADDYGKKWGRVKVPDMNSRQPEHPRHSGKRAAKPAARKQPSQQQPSPSAVVEGVPVPGYAVMVGNTQYMTYGMHPYAILHQVASTPGLASPVAASKTTAPPAKQSPSKPTPRVRLGYAAYQPPGALGKECSLDPKELEGLEPRGGRRRGGDAQAVQGGQAVQGVQGVQGAQETEQQHMQAREMPPPLQQVQQVQHVQSSRQHVPVREKQQQQVQSSKQRSGVQPRQQPAAVAPRSATSQDAEPSSPLPPGLATPRVAAARAPVDALVVKPPPPPAAAAATNRRTHKASTKHKGAAKQPPAAPRAPKTPAAPTQPAQPATTKHKATPSTAMQRGWASSHSTATTARQPPPRQPRAPEEVVVVRLRPWRVQRLTCTLTVDQEHQGVGVDLDPHHTIDPAHPLEVLLLVRSARSVAAAQAVGQRAQRTARPAPRGVAGLYQPPKRSTLEDLLGTVKARGGHVSVVLHVGGDAATSAVAVQLSVAL